MNQGTFESLKVIEIAGVLAGPSVGLFFAEMGARVIKIENKLQGGDVTRSWKLPEEDPDAPVSAYFSSVNWGKEYWRADFTNAADLDTVLRQIADADIVIVNFKKGDAEKFRLDSVSLRALNPNLIYAAISGFGEESDRVAYDLILQAESGFMSMNGTETSGPVKMPVAMIDLLAGHQLKEGILVALLRRMKTGKGSYVHVSLFDSAIASLANQASNWLMAGHNPGRIGSKHPNIAPYGEIFITADNRQVTLAIGSDNHFKKLCKVLGLEKIAENPLYRANQDRVKNRLALAGILGQQISKLQSATLVSALSDQHVPIAVIKEIREVFSDEKTNSLVLEEDIDGVKTRRVKSVAFKIV